MVPVKTSAERSRISDSAVKKSTGKTWLEWYRELDKLDAKRMNHQEIVAYLREHYDFGGWWFQMVTVAYEQGRGLRKVHEKPSGFEISKSMTMGASVALAYSAWRDSRVRKRWLSTGEFEIQTAARNKSMRITWSDKKTSLNVNFYPKGTDKCQVVVQHCKLKTARAAEKKEEYWEEKLAALKDLLEK